MISSEPSISVGILTAPTLEFAFCGNYLYKGLPVVSEKRFSVTLQNGLLFWNGNSYEELCFSPQVYDEDFFSLYGVTIGLHFHWERQELQSFRGILKLLPVAEGVLAINIVRAEVYLKSVIASEMKGSASKSFLMAHAVISRSWLFAQIEKRKGTKCCLNDHLNHYEVSNERIIRWYDREDHLLFDVCADDHCQRYQGINRLLSPAVFEAVDATRGLVLTYDGSICDARFSKCCGGFTEEFQYCWDDVLHPYMSSVSDLRGKKGTFLSSEGDVDRFIRTRPDAFCSAPSKEVLSVVLNDYDCETTDFYRWRKVFSQEELTCLIEKNTGIRFGKILSLSPLKRGASGRICELRITGTLRSLVIGKELLIRRVLSSSHLYSSAFVVDAIDIDENGVPASFIIHGAGWGHGVGLCQIGAAVMGNEGYSFSEILKHYYPTAILQRIYE